jgi:hypothetical protein
MRTSTRSVLKSCDDIMVWVGVPGMTPGFPSLGHLLVVEAEPEKAQEIRQVLRERSGTMVCEEVLAAEDGAMVRWHRFNDPRLNGPSELKIWQQRFPNLRQTDEEMRIGRRLGAVLDNFACHELHEASAQIHLRLRQGDPLAALMGLEAWVSQLETVHLMLPWPEETMELVEAWLRENFFRHDPESATIWKRDPIATRDRLLQEKEKENQDLLNANNQLHTCNEVVLSENKSLAADIERLSAHLEELSGRLINAETELQRLTTEVDSTRAENQNLQQDNDQKAHEITMLHESLHTKTALIAVIRDALRQLFPVDTYKRDNVDLSELDEEQLAIHYLEHGRKEGRLKTYQELDDALRLSNIRSEETESKLNLMASNYDLLKQQLEAIKDLFARLAEDPHSQKKDKDNRRE